MFPRREPLLWLQCLAIGVIPLELLLIRLALAGADPGPVPELERILTWGVSVLGPCLYLWKRPADWASLVLLRLPTNTRSPQQQQLSAAQTGALSRVPLIIGALALLVILWWLDDSAVLVQEFSPLSNRSRLASLLVSAPLLTLVLWQIQQLGQALQWLIQPSAGNAKDQQPFLATRLDNERTSLGLQLLNLPLIEWPEPPAPVPTPTPTPTPTASSSEQAKAIKNESESKPEPQSEPEQQREQKTSDSLEIEADPIKSKLREEQVQALEQPGGDAMDQPPPPSTEDESNENS